MLTPQISFNNTSTLSLDNTLLLNHKYPLITHQHFLLTQTAPIIKLYPVNHCKSEHSNSEISSEPEIFYIHGNSVYSNKYDNAMGLYKDSKLRLNVSYMNHVIYIGSNRYPGRERNIISFIISFPVSLKSGVTITTIVKI